MTTRPATLNREISLSEISISTTSSTPAGGRRSSLVLSPMRVMTIEPTTLSSEPPRTRLSPRRLAPEPVLDAVSRPSARAPGEASDYPTLVHNDAPPSYSNARLDSQYPTSFSLPATGTVYTDQIYILLKIRYTLHYTFYIFMNTGRCLVKHFIENFM